MIIYNFLIKIIEFIENSFLNNEILSRHTSNSIGNIANEVFEEFHWENDDTFKETDDFELGKEFIIKFLKLQIKIVDLLLKNKEKYKEKREEKREKILGNRDVFFNNDYLKKNYNNFFENPVYFSTICSSKHYFDSHSFGSNSRFFPHNKINEKNEKTMNFSAFFRDLFPKNSFLLNKFPIFSLFIQRVPNHDIFEEVWFYKASKGTIHGPFMSVDMDKLNSEGSFTMKSQLAWNQKNDFLEMEEFVKNPCFLINLAEKYMNIEKYFVNWKKFEGFYEKKDQQEERILSAISCDNRREFGETVK